MAKDKGTVETQAELTGELFPAEGHPRIGYKVFEILAEVLEDKDNLGLPRKWQRNYELGRNKHWRNKTDQATLLTANFLFTHRQQTVNMLTDNNPTFNVARLGDLGKNDQEDLYADLLRTCEFWWHDQEQQAVLEKSVINAETYGCCVEKVRFDPDIEYGIGEVVTEVVDPFNFGVWPVDVTDTQQAEVNLFYRAVSVREARRRWPEFATEISSDEEYLKELGNSRRQAGATGTAGEPEGYFTTFGGVVKNISNLLTGKGGGGKDSDNLLVVEAWVRDKSVVSSTDKEVPKYRGELRCITTCNGGKIVLSDRDNPSINPTLPLEQAQKTYLWDKFPFVFANSVTDPSLLWGSSDYEQLEDLQIEIDKTLSQIALYKDRAARLKIINPKTSGVHNSQFNNAPGIIQPANANEALGVRYLEPPPIPADLPAAKQLFQDLFFQIAGTYDLNLARDKTSNTLAYKSIAVLLDRASTMMRGKIRNSSKLIRERGRMYIGCVQNWYTEDHWITYTDDDGEERSKTVRGTKMIVPAKMTVVSGSTMPRSQVQEREEAIELAKMGVIDGIELLKKMDWPNWKAVVSRMQAGPLGLFLEKLAAANVPPVILEYFQQIAQMDPKDVQTAMEKGEIPPFDAILEAMFGALESGAEPQEAPTDLLAEIELEEKRVAVEKTKADIALIQAKIDTETTEQELNRARQDLEASKAAEERERSQGGTA